MGTLFTIRVCHPDEGTGYRAIAAAFGRMHGLDAALSDYRHDSELNRLCREAHQRRFRASQDLFRVVDASLRLARETDGAFDITLGPVIRLWREARRAGQLPDARRLREARSRTGWHAIETDAQTCSIRLPREGMQLDLGGIAKGFAAGEALLELRRHGVESALVAAGGDIAVSGPPPSASHWTVALETGRESSPPRVHLATQAVSTSGDLYQFVEIEGHRYSHIVSPRTGIGLTSPLSVSVVAREAMAADGTATALSVMGLSAAQDWVRRHPHVQARIIHSAADGPAQVWHSPDFPLEMPAPRER